MSIAHIISNSQSTFSKMFYLKKELPARYLLYFHKYPLAWETGNSGHACGMGGPFCFVRGPDADTHVIRGRTHTQHGVGAKYTLTACNLGQGQHTRPSPTATSLACGLPASCTGLQHNAPSTPNRAHLYSPFNPHSVQRCKHHAARHADNLSAVTGIKSRLLVHTPRAAEEGTGYITKITS